MRRNKWRMWKMRRTNKGVVVDSDEKKYQEWRIEE